MAAQEEVGRQQQKARRTRVILFPGAGMGHFIPMLELAKRLSKNNNNNNLSITFITAKYTVPQSFLDDCKASISSHSSSSMDIIFKQIPSIPELSVSSSMFLNMYPLQQKTKPLLEDMLRQETEEQPDPISAFVTDFFNTPFFDIPPKFQIPVYCFFVASASLLCYMLHSPTISEETLMNPESILQIPGLPQLRRGEIHLLPPEEAAARLRWFLDHCRRLSQVRGFLVNSSEKMENQQFKALRGGKFQVLEPDTEFWAVGPVIRATETEEEEEREENSAALSECLLWLDLQPPRSVLFVAFGSMGELGELQIAELAHGLELSEQRFLWVLQKMHGMEGDPRRFLPESFERRIVDRGRILVGWAPQVRILQHQATGGFLTHCGWNSVMESILWNVPLIAWPLVADQKLNALLFVNELQIAVGMVKSGNSGSESGFEYGRDEVKQAVMDLMGGIIVRENVGKLSDVIKAAIAPGGSSFEGLVHAIQHWKNSMISEKSHV